MFGLSPRKPFSSSKEENTTIKKLKNIEIMLENKLEIGEFINIFLLILGEILGTEKRNLCKS